MKKLLLVLAALSVGAMFLPSGSTAQDTVVNFYHGTPPQTTLPPIYRGPVATGPVGVAPPLYAGSGCVGRTGGGCQGRSGGYMLMVPMTAGGCQGRTGGGCVGRSGGGCQGGMAFAPGYGGYAAVPVYGGPLPYGASLGDGRFATPSGRPAPPGIVPWNDPIIGTIRAASGYDRHYRP